VRLWFGTPQKDFGDLCQVDGSDFNQGNDKSSQKVDAYSIPRYILVKRALQSAIVVASFQVPFGDELEKDNGLMAFYAVSKIIFVLY
jgi:hypothetical protein